MKIKYMEIQNFRRLKNCKIELGDKNTLFVGANNSGKTSAMNALVKFLTKSSLFTINDFTVLNWNTIISIGKTLLRGEETINTIILEKNCSIFGCLDRGR